MFKRISNLIKGFFGLFIGGIEKKNPQALLEVEKENLRKQISEFNKGLAAHAGLVEKLITQVKKLNKDEADFRTKTKAHLNAGNRQLAGEFALKLKNVEQEHDELSSQLTDAETRYNELVKARDVSVKQAKERMEQLRRDMDEMKVQTAMADLNEMAAGMVTEMGGAGDSLNRLEGIVEEERTRAAGRARVAKDSLDMSEINMKDSEQDALAEMALADFAAEQGIELEGGASKTPSSETEGGAQASQTTLGPDSESTSA